MSPEFQLLLLCARSRLSSQQRDSLCELLKEKLDWDRLLGLTVYHGVTSFLLNHLSSVSRAGEFPLSEVLNRLHAGLFRDIQGQMFLTDELLRIFRLFESQKIPAIAFKGPALSFFLYGDPTFRPSGDLDLLVRKETFPAAREVLHQMGYRSRYDELTPRRRRAALHCEWSDMLCRTVEKRGVIVDLHWDILPVNFFLPLNSDDFWKRAQPIWIKGTRVFIHGTEDLFLTLCAHGGKDRWKRIWCLVDISELIQNHPEIHWKRLMERAKILGAQRILGLGLFLAHDLLDADLPPWVLQKVRSDPEIPLVAKKMKKNLLGDERGKALGSLRFRLSFYWKMKERWRDKIRDMLHHIFIFLTPTRKEWDRLPLPDAWFPLYYFFRPLRLAKKYAGKWRKKGTKKREAVPFSRTASRK